MIGRGPSAAATASKSLRPGPGTQVPLLGGGGGGRHVPRGLEPPEVIDAQEIHEGEAAPEALDPEAIAIGGEPLPAIEGVSPPLSRG